MRLSLFEDHLKPLPPLNWGAAVRAVFVFSGSALIQDSTGKSHQLTEHACVFLEGSVRIQGEAQLWTFELSRTASSEMTEEEQSRCIMSHDVGLENDHSIIFRMDRVEFPQGMVTPKHGHKGPGIRRLYAGRLVAEIGQDIRRINQGDAWFETGHEPVVGKNIAPFSGFVRAMALPADLLGKTSFIAWNDEEAAKPRGTQRTEYFDQLVSV